MSKQLIIVILMGILSFLFGCKTPDSKKPVSENANLEAIDSRINPEEGWGDIFLKIVDETKTDSSRIYIAKGVYQGKTVGLQIEVSSKIGAGIVNGQPNGKAGFVSHAVSFSSIGQESNDFVKALADLYRQPTNKGFTEQKLSLTVFSLNEMAVDLDKRNYYKLKLFFETDEEYSEAYLNINTDRREIEFHEKDHEYRETLIKILTK